MAPGEGELSREMRRESFLAALLEESAEAEECKQGEE
jgi:hypothetical protein